MGSKADHIQAALRTTGKDSVNDLLIAFFSALEGATNGQVLKYDGTTWDARNQFNQTTPRPAIANPTGGTTIDTEARAAINSILTVLRDLGIISP